MVRLPEAAFARLRDLALAVEAGDQSSFLRAGSVGGHDCVQVANYVGAFRIDDAWQIEVLPKTTHGEGGADVARALLWKMLRVVNRLPAVESDRAVLGILDSSWVEAMIRWVLDSIGRLIRGGLRNDYVRRNDETAFLRGRLRTELQIRQRPGRAQHFNVSYEAFLADIPENRLIKSSLEVLNGWTGRIDNKRLCRELLHAMDPIAASSNVDADLRSWRSDRALARYQPLLPWIRLILRSEAPAFASSDVAGVSLLFPMERLFEEYVAAVLERHVAGGVRVQAQRTGEHLVHEHRGRPWFQLRPDLTVVHNGRTLAVLDTKWKLLDAAADRPGENYRLDQADFYQLFAYGMKYLRGRGELMLIYPRHPGFRWPLAPFQFTESLRAWVVPFDLDRDILIDGYWEHTWPWLRRERGDSEGRSS